MTALAERPADEGARLDAVRRYDILDTPPDGAFDRITALAARLCHAPISTISIVDEDRIWFKSAYGLAVDQVDRDPGLCASAIIREGPHVVADAIEDPRTLDNPLVRGELGLRFYIGIPLTTADGHNLGTLNVIDVQPRAPTQEELDTLSDLAAIVVDELELRLSARRIIEAEAAREAAEFRASLLAGISHEMRTHISILNGVASLDPDERFDEEEVHALLRRHVRHLDWLVNQYLDFTALEAGRTPSVDPDANDLPELARDAAGILAADATVDLRAEPDLPAVLADRHRTRQILIELLNNAIRFSPPDAPVEVEICAGGDGTVAVSVTDRGRGLPVDDPERVFDKLYRGRDSRGTGIGLYVARALAEAQDGRIDAEAVPGRGARFTLRLPAIAA